MGRWSCSNARLPNINLDQNKTNIILPYRPLLGWFITICRFERADPAVPDTEQLHRGPGLLCQKRAAPFRHEQQQQCSERGVSTISMSVCWIFG